MMSRSLKPKFKNLMNSDTTNFPITQASVASDWNLEPPIPKRKSTLCSPGQSVCPSSPPDMFTVSTNRIPPRHVSTLLENGSGGSLRQGLCRKARLAMAVAMAEEEAQEEKGMTPAAAPRIDAALPLLDFDWKLKYAVASGSIATVTKSFLRLELYTSKCASKVQVPELRRTLPDNQTRTWVAEYSKAELDELIQEMDGIVQALEGVESAT